jgi:hypothetical protein
MNTYFKPVLFADDINVLITGNNVKDMQMRSSSILNYMSKQFAANGLSLNIDKTYAVKLNLKSVPRRLFSNFL